MTKKEREEIIRKAIEGLRRVVRSLESTGGHTAA